MIVRGKRVPAIWNSHQGCMVPKWQICLACEDHHPTGSCPLKRAGVELCPLCGVAHYGVARQCSHIRSETMVNIMLDQLKHSPEDGALVEAATKYLHAMKGNFVQNKKNALETAQTKAKVFPDRPPQPSGTAVSPAAHSASIRTTNIEVTMTRSYAPGYDRLVASTSAGPSYRDSLPRHPTSGVVGATAGKDRDVAAHL